VEFEKEKGFDQERTVKLVLSRKVKISDVKKAFREDAIESDKVEVFYSETY